MRTIVPVIDSDLGNCTNRATVYLNVYDVTNINNYLYWLGLGIFHSGIEVHGVEYAFGAHDYPSSGVFEVEPRNCPGFIYRRSIALGTTNMNSEQVRQLMEHVARDYTGDSYHLIAKNCNHFTNEVCLQLTKKTAPGWVNRLANIGSFCSCLLPESLQVTTIRQMPEYNVYEDDVTYEVVLGKDGQDQHLLTVPNGIIQSQMQENYRDIAAKENT